MDFRGFRRILEANPRMAARPGASETSKNFAGSPDPGRTAGKLRRLAGSRPGQPNPLKSWPEENPSKIDFPISQNVAGIDLN